MSTVFIKASAIYVNPIDKISVLTGSKHLSVNLCELSRLLVAKEYQRIWKQARSLASVCRK